MAKLLEVKGLEELSKRMRRYPVQFTKAMALFMASALLTLNENVPPYPPQPTDSTYRRTGTLGRSIGSGISGGKVGGGASIFQVRKQGSAFVGKFGTNLRYAPKVIGSRSQQADFFAQFWWRLEQIIGPAFPKILKLANTTAEKLAKFLEGRAI